MTKYLLAFDAAADTVELAVARCLPGDGTVELVHSSRIVALRAANALLLERINEVLDAEDIQPGGIAACVVGRGPGSFTGVRIGVATAKGLAQGLGIPLYGVSSTDAVAAVLARDGVTGPVAIALDAMRKEVYPAFVELSAEGKVLRGCSDYVATPTEAAADFVAACQAQSSGELALIGSGSEKYSACFEEAFEAAGIRVKRLATPPYAGGLVDALLAARSGGCDTVRSGYGVPSAVLPIYTRLSDAEENEKKKAREAGAGAACSPEASEPGAEAAADVVAGAGDSNTLAAAARLDATCPLVRQLTPLDLDAVVRLAADVEQLAWSRAQWAAELSNPDHVWLAAFLPDEEGRACPVACGGAADLSGDFELLMLATASVCRRRGYARELLKRLDEVAMERSAASIFLEVRASNAAAQALYESAGFRPCGRRKDYYPSGSSESGGDAASPSQAQRVRPAAATPAEDAVLLKKELALPPLPHPRILGIESSCDETAAALSAGDSAGDGLLTNVIASQVPFHARFGGVVPEIASRKHTEALVPTVEEAMRLPAVSGATSPARLPFSALDALAVTDRPGLIGALVVGLAYAKGLAYATGKPLYGIHHLEGHLFAVTLSEKQDLPLPFVALIVSGGHTSLIYSPRPHEYQTLGQTLDDATGEAFDKVAKALGLGYPGGPILSKLAATGDPAAIDFPRAMLKSGDYAFSLSGLKTAVMQYIQAEKTAGRSLNLPNLAASFQQAIIEVQCAKVLRAVQEYHVRHFVLAGGVAANAALRQALTATLTAVGVKVHIPDLAYCGDNAAMIVCAAAARLSAGVSGACIDALDRGAEASAHAPLEQS